MTLKDQIKKDSITYRKAKDPRAKIMSTLLGEISTKEKQLNPTRELTDQEIRDVVQKFIKNVKETISHVDSQELGAHLMETEIEPLEAYMPKQMSEEELENQVAVYLASNPGANMGQVMGYFKQQFPGQYDGKVLASVVKGLV